MNYEKIYNSLCSKTYNDEYTEIHHIIPRCLGGDDSSSNLVRLSAKAHYLAHLLLCRIYPDNIKLKFALNMMSRSNSKQVRNLTLTQYETIKKENSIALSELHSTRIRSETEKANISKALTGKKKTEEHKRKCSEWQKGKPKPWQVGKPRKGSGRPKGSKNSNPHPKRTKEHMDKIIETNRKNREPSLNTLGYEILTTEGFQPFDGVSYNGLVSVLEFKTKDHSIRVSYKHRFDNSDKKAKDYKVGDILITESGPQPIVSIEKAGKAHVYDILDVKNGNLYLANGIQNHNCEIIRDERKTVIPEFTEELQNSIVQEYIKPPFYHPYVSMDLGFKDLTVCLFAYYDFKKDKIIIEDEIVRKGSEMKLDIFSKQILEKEETLWYNHLTNEKITPEARISDVDLIVIQEINRQSYGLLNFQPVRKEPGYKKPLINQLRIMLEQEKIIIDPKCVTLIRHLRNARWKDSSAKDDFARSPDDGHYDALDALLYLVKSISYTKNPYPKNYNNNYYDTFGSPNVKNTQNQTPREIYDSIFGKRKKR